MIERVDDDHHCSILAEEAFEPKEKITSGFVRKICLRNEELRSNEHKNN